MINISGYFRYGVSKEERFENLFKAILHGSKIAVAEDNELLTLSYEDGETLPVWLSEAEAMNALPTDRWPKFKVALIEPVEFKNRFGHSNTGMYVSVRPDPKGQCITIPLTDFIQRIS